jgi:hypothetical protein
MMKVPHTIMLETWWPVTGPVCVNGREWLAPPLRRRGVAFEQLETGVCESTLIKVGSLWPLWPLSL